MVRLLAGGAVDLGAPAVGPVGLLGAAAQHAEGGAPHLGLCELEGRRRLLGEVLAGTLRVRSEEHTSELQSRGHLVCRLLREKKDNSNDRESASRRCPVVGGAGVL